MKIKNFPKGFTLIELLVVMAILGVLATIGFGSFRSSQIKGRDARRKSDLANIQKALEMYYNDYGSYPSSDLAGGTIGSFSWGGEMKDVNGTLYMVEIPRDPTGLTQYCYKSSGLFYQLYAKLENINDLQKLQDTVTCGGDASYNYGISSSNTKP